MSDTFKDRDQRKADMILAMGLFDLTDRDRRFLEWLAEADQETTDAATDLFHRLASRDSR